MQPDRKIAQLSMGIGELEQRANALLSQRDGVENRALTGVQVMHRSFGSGEVVCQTGRLFTVAFSQGQKQFLFPDAFGQAYLTTPDPQLQADLEKYQQLTQKLESVQHSIRTAQRQIHRLQKM